MAYSCDHVGPLARSVADLQAIQAVLDPAFGKPPASKLRQRLRVGISPGYYSDADALVAQTMAHVVATLRKARHVVRTVRTPHPDRIMHSHMVTVTREAAKYHTEKFQDLWRAHPDIARSGIELGRGFSDQDYDLAQSRRRRIASTVESLFESLDILILPTLPFDAPARNAESVVVGEDQLPILEATIRYTALFNHTGHPVVSLPAFRLPDGRALSVQVVGRRNDDPRLLAIARALEDVFSVTVNYGDLARAAQMSVRRLRRQYA